MAQTVLEEGVVVVPLSPLDAIMGSMGLTIIYVFPPTLDRPQYDLDRVHAALISTLEEDYPLFIGKPHMDPTTGAVGIQQTPATRAAGAQATRFFRDTECLLTTKVAVQKAPLSFLPPRERDDELMTVKATLLSDGGLVIGMNASHALLDGEGMFTFFNVWSMHYRNVPPSERPMINHDRHLVAARGVGWKLPHPEFIQPKTIQPETPAGVAAKGGDAPMAFPPTTQKAFHISPNQLKKLKAAVMSGVPVGEYVSTIDVVTALFTVLITQARGHGDDVKITTGVNARSRLDPPLPPNYAGNVIFNALSSYQAQDLMETTQSSLQLVAQRIRTSILLRDEAFMRDAIEYIAMDGRKWVDMRAGVEFFFGKDLMFTSWANMGMYDADFGAGKSVYTGPPMLPVCDGMVIIMEGIYGTTGLDVLPLLECKAMEKLTQLWEECELLKE